MRKHPLLAIFTATATFVLSTSGVLDQSASASSTPIQRVHQQPHERSDLEALAVHDTPRSRMRPPVTHLSSAMPLTFAVTGAPVLGSYVPPAVRRRRLEAEARRRALARRRAEARRRARLAALHRARTAPAGGVWAELRSCESGGNYAENTGNGYYGAYQFLPSTWWSLGFTGLPNQAAPAVQDRAARMLLARQGWGAWPVCSQMLGL